MYILELITKFLRKKEDKSKKDSWTDHAENIIENSQDCEHLFLPIDSTNQYFACKYCGFVISKES